MAQHKASRKLGFPNMSEKQYRVYHERLIQAEKIARALLPKEQMVRL